MIRRVSAISNHSNKQVQYSLQKVMQERIYSSEYYSTKLNMGKKIKKALQLIIPYLNTLQIKISNIQNLLTHLRSKDFNLFMRK